MTEEVYKEAAQNVTAWYRQYGRDLPWRRTGNPYHIWISEIMLQQTQVDTVKPYYERFIETLPTVEDLAGADEQRVFKLWEGLGYYRRASHLKEAASMIVNEYSKRHCQYCFWHSEGRCGRQYTENCCQIV